MAVVAILALTAFLVVALIVWLLRRELDVKRTADDFAAGRSDHYCGHAADLSFDRERLGA